MSDNAFHPTGDEVADESADETVDPTLGAASEDRASAGDEGADRADDADGEPHTDPVDDLASGPAAEPETVHQGPPAPETGDLVIDAALRDLAEAPEDDLDAQVERGEQVQRTLQGRLSDLGG